MRLSKQRLWLLGGGAVIVLAAAAFSILQIQMGKSVGAPALMARYVLDLPTDPLARQWGQAAAVKLPLSALSTPGAAAREVTVRALTDGRRLAFRVEWPDDSQELTTLRPQDFADAAAVQLADGNIGVCMGQADQFSHIWQWKADWQYGSREMKTQYPNLYTDGYQIGDQKLFDEPLFTSPAAAVGNIRSLVKHTSNVEHLIAGGFSTLTTAPATLQTVSGNGAWNKGTWSVVFVRDLGTPENDYPLAPGTAEQVAFAVWHGNQMQRDGMKYTTGWATLTVNPGGARK